MLAAQTCVPEQIDLAPIYALDCICSGAHIADMLTVLTTDDFASWFRELDDRDAEEVATGIVLIEKLGPERSPPASSEILLWYQSGSGDPRIDGYYASEMIAYAHRTRLALKQLSSKRVQQRLAVLPRERAALVSASLTLIRERTRAWRHNIPDEARYRNLQAVLAEYRRALDMLELEEAKPETAAQTLRELNLADRKPNLRVLYGVDIPNARALVILGEQLDKNAYGPSVRRALAVWQRFLQDSAGDGALAAGSSK